MEKPSKGSDLLKKKERKNGVTMHLRQLSTFELYRYKNTHHRTTVSVFISYSARALDAWRGVALRRELRAR